MAGVRGSWTKCVENKALVRVTTPKYAVVTLLSTFAPSRLGETSTQKREVSRGLSTWGVNVSPGQGTRRGTTANYAVVIRQVISDKSVSVVQVEVGDGERKVGDGERRVGDGGCQGCYDVVRDSRPLLRRERPPNFIEVHRGCLLLSCGNYIRGNFDRRHGVCCC
ncbi:hypothetical protein TREMEDRAFT_59172 [Tremella mesenterica DSM 1558]|uniref:uncharacterized protein n=1 Tax=Tremella mesenterica (strain ATCC 24925 / CBS 8224 / DSM 1558 / NBRC 9311 / NRRL Y-6157 / RJB 2259-6 / UBC 559-6) TaxID=578456 RepID=UPI0003F493ED|nr:uncharacterized protein TREMEDRAFT_59172 [Tremella mesenterica DSM 1558]EIW73010.1 hypothetical protein TREMEDRAFT_59172 [Tremella mesenterica DSM 1558]